MRWGGDRGLQIHRGTEVTGFNLQGGRVQGLHTNQGDYNAGIVVLTTGAWPPALGRLLGREWDSQHVHGQALVTEPSPHRLRNHISSAAFFESMHEGSAEQARLAVLAVAQSGNGNFLLGESGAITIDLGKHATMRGQAAIAAEALRFMPVLKGLRWLVGGRGRGERPGRGCHHLAA